MKLRQMAIATLACTGVVLAGSFEDDVIPVKKVTKFDLAALEFKKVSVYPQTSVRLNDRNTKEADISEIEVGSAITAKDLFVVVRWKDETFSVQPTLTTNRYGDGISVQFPLSYGKGKPLPYIGMGNEKNPVYVYIKKNVENRDYVKSYVSEGFGSMTEIKDSGFEFSLSYNSEKKEYTAVFRKQVKPADLKPGIIPVSFAVWDGDNKNRDGVKNISSWKFLRIPGVTVDKAYLSYISWGYNKIGDPERGKELMIQNGCTGCHNFADQNNATQDLAPNLSRIGGYNNPIYLKESIINPSAVVIRNLNINRHYDKSQSPDKNGAYPNNEMYTWYTKDAKGNKTSKMPPYNFLPEQDINDMVEYLKTLK